MELVIEERAAVMCSKRMRSTVAKKGGSSSPRGGDTEDIVRIEDIIRVEDSPPFGSAERDGERDLELPPGECNGEVQSLLRDIRPVPGVKHPGLGCAPAPGTRSACDDALSRRLVVPRAFVEPDRAEHTTATLWSSI